MLERIEEIRNNLKYQYNNEKNEYEELIELYELAYSTTKKVIYLIELCRVEKMMFSKTTARIKKFSKFAFQHHPSEKTLYFYLAAHVSNGNFDICMKNLHEAFMNIQDKNLYAIKKLYEGGLYALRSDYYLYNKLISMAKDEYQGKLYWQLQYLITQYDFGIGEKYFLNKDVRLGESLKYFEKYDYIFSISADYIYFQTYFEYFYKSFTLTNPTGAIHLSLVNCTKYKQEIYEILKNKENIRVSFFDFSEEYDHRPISAVMRLLVINELLVEYKKPVFFGEIDGVVLSCLKAVIENLRESQSSQLVRVIGSYLPWQRYTCGFGLYLYAEETIFTTNLLKQYIKGMFNHTQKHWWMDQLALEASIRFSLLVNYKYNYYAPNMSYINQFVYTPVGGDAKDKKIFYLKNKIFELEKK